MATDDEFTSRLVGFGLSEKEAQVYLHLLKYGPKTPSPIAKTLKTYREDVHRTLNSLIEKGMVRPSLGSPTVYTAVELDAALASALRKHESELREMQVRKRELQELAKHQQFLPSSDVATFKILKSIREVNSTAIPVMLSAKDEYVWLSNRQGVEFGEAFGFFEAEKEFIERGGEIRGITDISYRLIDLIRHLLESLTKSTASVRLTLTFSALHSMSLSACSIPTTLCLLTISFQLSKWFGSRRFRQKNEYNSC
jgi:sugar-specific transcriptional regulator TrmB